MAVRDDNWYRRPARTAAERDSFEARLARARATSRPQYLRIQGHALLGCGDAESALALFERAAHERSDPLLAWVTKAVGDCHRALGRTSAALDAYRRSIAHMRERPNVGSHAQLDLAGLVLEHSLRDCYQEAVGFLAEFWDPDPIFPAYELEQFGFLALLLDKLGQPAEAEAAARRALAAAARTPSGAAKHRRLGLATAKHRPLIRKLERAMNVLGRKPGDARHLFDRLKRRLRRH